MELSPNLFYEKFLENEITKISLREYLISFIENSENEQDRIESIEILKEIDARDGKTFSLLENLLVSDHNSTVRKVAIQFLFQKYQEKTLSIIHWALDHEQDYECYTMIVHFLENIQTLQAKSLLIQEVNKIRKKKYLFDEKKTTNRAFRKDLKNLLKSQKLEDLDNEILSEIIINFKTITTLKEKFYSVYYELENAVVSTLDLSDVEFEVRGWKSEFKNEISKLTEITGLKNLKKLKTLYLSNNQISDIKDLIELKKLTHLHISKNLINDPKNIQYIKEMHNLEFLDISENGIADKINKKNFDTIVIIDRRSGTFMI